uniref:Carotenoid cleavage dioxygenase 1 n=1 Tax=Tanacetum cinerariifolium TaxID=118510 RepID=A0A6L2P7F0_TANCI|nr:carotenoid cleavage dioxygenase 1 [Tanacetum cinerariifolium]
MDFSSRTTGVFNPIRSPSFRLSVSVSAQQSAFAVGVLSDLYAFHRSTGNSLCPYHALRPIIPDNACILCITAAAGTELADAYSPDTVIASSPGKEVYDPWAFYLHAALLRQAFAHCGKFPTAASRRSLGRVSVPVWLIILSDQLLIIALDSIQPHVPLWLPCYDFTPVEDPTVVCANKTTKSLCGTSGTQKSWVIIDPLPVGTHKPLQIAGPFQIEEIPTDPSPIGTPAQLPGTCSSAQTITVTSLPTTPEHQEHILGQQYQSEQQQAQLKFSLLTRQTPQLKQQPGTQREHYLDKNHHQKKNTDAENAPVFHSHMRPESLLATGRHEVIHHPQT